MPLPKASLTKSWAAGNSNGKNIILDDFAGL